MSVQYYHIIETDVLVTFVLYVAYADLKLFVELVIRCSFQYLCNVHILFQT